MTPKHLGIITVLRFADNRKLHAGAVHDAAVGCPTASTPQRSEPSSLRTLPPVSTTTNSLTTSTSLLSRRAMTCQRCIGCPNRQCFQGGAGAPAELVRSSCSRLVDKGFGQQQVRRSTIRFPTTTTKYRGARFAAGARGSGQTAAPQSDATTPIEIINDNG
ncbi:hypothetical protein FVEN_g13153 [Fusarium venenatum]|nr:hypothetical protein FVEN_g13153 [Fusarium venenatum]